MDYYQVNYHLMSLINFFSGSGALLAFLNGGVLMGSYWFLRSKFIRHASNVVASIVTSKETQVATQTLVEQLLSNTATQVETKKFLIELLSDHEVQDQIKTTMITIFETPEMKLATNQLVTSILQDEDTLKETRAFVSELLNSEEIQKDLQESALSLMKLEETQTTLTSLLTASLNSPEMIVMIQEFLQKKETVDSLNELVKTLIDNPATQFSIQQFLIETLKNSDVKVEVYAHIKNLLEEVMKDQEFNNIIVTFLSQTFMNSLDEPVNEKYIKDKMIEIMTSEDIKSAVSVSVIEVVEREDLKKSLGDNAVEALTSAIRKQYPKLAKWNVV